MTRVGRARFVALAVAGACTMGAPPRSAGEIRWERFEGSTILGAPVDGEIGRIDVPENRGEPAGGETIEIAFVRYRTTNPNPGPPIFFLVGGPGGSGVSECARVATHPQIRLLEHADVIGVDQRGTGESRPNLADPEFRYALPLDRAIDREDAVRELGRVMAECCSYWTARGIDLDAYDTDESADDLDAVRAALGLERVVLFGSSYGSHLGLAYRRRHPDRVARAVFDKVEGPDQTWKLPSTIQRHLEALHAAVARDPAASRRVPDLLGGVRALTERLAAEPPTVEIGDARTRVVLGPYDLRVWLAQSLATSTERARVPAALERMLGGDWAPLGEAALANRRGIFPSPMSVRMDCASGASSERLDRLRREASDPTYLLGDAIDFPLFRDLCDACPGSTLEDAFRGDVAADAPVLFVSGTLDARTPPENVEAIRASLPNAAHVVVENAGHESRELMSPEYRRLLQAFLRGESVVDGRVVLPQPRWEGLAD